MYSSNMLKSPLNILLVEDNEIDVEAVERAFKKADIKWPLQSACDGVEALAMLRGSDGKTKLAQPCLILLDINMPRMDGIQFLNTLRSDEGLKQSIVFMLTTSNRSGDRMLAYMKNIAGYFLKENLDTLVSVIAPYCKGNEFPEPMKAS